MKKIPRGKTPSLIGSANGRPKRVQVIRKSLCSRCETEISAGAKCIAIPKTGSAFKSEKRFCDECYSNILKQTIEDLEEIKKL